MRSVVAIILDGWGYREDKTDNAVAVANTPNFDRLWNEYPHTLLQASGLAVGLPKGQPGNSEICHTTIGAGTVIDTDLVRITKAAEAGELGQNPVIQELFAHVKRFGSTLHIQGLVSPGGVHSHSDHLYAFLRAAKEAGITKIAIHAFTDGRDVLPRSGADYLRELEDVLAELSVGHIATVSGRFYAMDRDNNWHRLAQAEAAMFQGEGVRHTSKPSEALKIAYQNEGLDEHLEPMVFLDQSGKSYPISQNDAVFIFNFRSDRARMLTKKILEKRTELNLAVATMTQYDSEFDVPVVFAPAVIETTLAAEVAKAGLKQTHIAETEKYPHVTYFLNGGQEKPHEGEEHIMLDSRKDVTTHDQAPKMRAEGIADAAITEINKEVPFIFLNFANPDMVGHTGNKEAIIEALEETDLQLGRVIKVVGEKGYVALITADHGNAEVNIDPASGEKHTAHTTNLVPLIMVGGDKEIKKGSLADLAPTILALLDLSVPASMTGQNLLN